MKIRKLLAAVMTVSALGGGSMLAFAAPAAAVPSSCMDGYRCPPPVECGYNWQWVPATSSYHWLPVGHCWHPEMEPTLRTQRELDRSGERRELDRPADRPCRIGELPGFVDCDPNISRYRLNGYGYR